MITTATMRRLDRWIGVPLCFIATLLARAGRLLRRHQPPTRTERVLFIELSEMGSAILADPAIRHAHDKLGVTPYFVIFKHNRDSLRLTGTIPEERIFTLSTRSLPELLSDTIRFLRWCRRERIDTTVDLELFARFTALLAIISGARKRVGFHRFAAEGLYRGDLLTHRVGYSPHRHIARNFLALVSALEFETLSGPDLPLDIDGIELVPHHATTSTDARDRVHTLLEAHLPADTNGNRMLVLINASCGEHLPQRRWPAAHFAGLIHRLLDWRQDLVVVLIGSRADHPYTWELATALGSPRCIDLAGEVALPDLPALFEASSLLVSNDAGPAHFASTTALPTIVLFGPETPALYRPLGDAVALSAGLACSPCVSAFNHRSTACSDNVCMRAIDVATVFDNCTRLLERRVHGTVIPLSRPG